MRISQTALEELNLVQVFQGSNISLAQITQNEKNYTIATITSDNGRELQNERFEIFCESLELSTIFQLQELHKKMGLLRGKIEI